MQNLLALFSDPAALAALATLIIMEVVLGIDNLIFISILTNKLPEHRRAGTTKEDIQAAGVKALKEKAKNAAPPRRAMPRDNSARDSPSGKGNVAEWRRLR